MMLGLSAEDSVVCRLILFKGAKKSTKLFDCQLDTSFYFAVTRLVAAIVLEL